MGFVNGYLTVIARETENIKDRMLSHLQELMEDGQHYGWATVRSYHVALLQNLEQGQATWEDEETKLKR